MLFGLCNAPTTFDQTIERVLSDVPRSACVVYLDDLLIHAATFEEALPNLREVLNQISAAGLKLLPGKCHLMRQKKRIYSATEQA